jgi:hypothetical protein
MKFRLRNLLLAITFLAVVLGGIVAAGHWLGSYTELERFRLPDGSELRLTVNNWHDEGSRSILWQRFIDGEPQHARHAFGYCDPDRVHDAEFSVESTTDGDLVVVVESQNPDVVLGLIEFSSGVVYPGDRSGSVDEYYAGMNLLLQKLRDQRPRQSYVLSHQVPGNRRLLVR